MRFRPVLISAVALTALGCGGTDEDSTLTVFAAASLTAPFTELAAAFEQANPGVDVVLNLAASSDLAAQIGEGSPADVFASADVGNMDKVAARIVGDVATFATNRLQIVTEPGNPLGIASLADLADPRVLVVTCADDVPIGAYTAEVLRRAGIEVNPVSFEESVKGIVTKVASGEADAGIVYATDVLAAGTAVSGVEIPDPSNLIVTYPIATLTSDRTADAFVDFVRSDEGQAILRSFGFGAP